jgi:hypothetical protein
MTRDGLRRLLAWGIVAALLLPVLLVVLLGLAALLDVLGDRTLIGGIAWIGSLVVSVAANAVLTLVGHDARAGRRRRLRGRRRRVRPEPAVQEQTPTFAAVRSATERASGAG